MQNSELKAFKNIKLLGEISNKEFIRTILLGANVYNTIESCW